MAFCPRAMPVPKAIIRAIIIDEVYSFRILSLLRSGKSERELVTASYHRVGFNLQKHAVAPKDVG
jgi:hypothetical protein